MMNRAGHEAWIEGSSRRWLLLALCHWRMQPGKLAMLVAVGRVGELGCVNGDIGILAVSIRGGWRLVDREESRER